MSARWEVTVVLNEAANNVTVKTTVEARNNNEAFHATVNAIKTNEHYKQLINSPRVTKIKKIVDHPLK